MPAARDKYRSTIVGCFNAYIVQAITNNFLPLLFLALRKQFGLRLDELAFLVALNFGIQLFVDFISIFFVDRIGYKRSLIIAHFCAACGLISLGLLPGIMRNSLMALSISVLLSAVGGGIIEVIISPLIDATPTEHKAALMSALHSFYCWGHLAVILISTLFFIIFGQRNWPVLAVIWAAHPLINTFVFAKAPIPFIPGSELKGKDRLHIFKKPVFYVFSLLMVASGAMEHSVAQWASTFAEGVLNLDKAAGDLMGPALFALAMGTSRAVYGKWGKKTPVMNVMLFSGLLSVLSLLILGLVPNPQVSFLGFALAGLSVGIMWPGVLSLSSNFIKNGGTMLFAFLALAGDLGCSLGPQFVGLVAGDSLDMLKTGLLSATVFPLIFLLTLILLFVRRKN